MNLDVVNDFPVRLARITCERRESVARVPGVGLGLMGMFCFLKMAGYRLR